MISFRHRHGRSRGTAPHSAVGYRALRASSATHYIFRADLSLELDDLDLSSVATAGAEPERRQLSVSTFYRGNLRTDCSGTGHFVGSAPVLENLPNLDRLAKFDCRIRLRPDDFLLDDGSLVGEIGCNRPFFCNALGRADALGDVWDQLLHLGWWPGK